MLWKFAGREDFFLENNKRVYPFIRYLRVSIHFQPWFFASCKLHYLKKFRLIINQCKANQTFGFQLLNLSEEALDCIISLGTSIIDADWWGAGVGGIQKWQEKWILCSWIEGELGGRCITCSWQQKKRNPEFINSRI